MNSRARYWSRRPTHAKAAISSASKTTRVIRVGGPNAPPRAGPLATAPAAPASPLSQQHDGQPVPLAHLAPILGHDQQAVGEDERLEDGRVLVAGGDRQVRAVRAARQAAAQVVATAGGHGEGLAHLRLDRRAEALRPRVPHELAQRRPDEELEG